MLTAAQRCGQCQAASRQKLKQLIQLEACDTQTQHHQETKKTHHMYIYIYSDNCLPAVTGKGTYS